MIRRNQTTIGHQGQVVNIAAVNLNVDPRSIRDVDDLIRLVKAIPTSARQVGGYPVRATYGSTA